MLCYAMLCYAMLCYATYVIVEMPIAPIIIRNSPSTLHVIVEITHNLT
jgi:hypothetical protein